MITPLPPPFNVVSAVFAMQADKWKKLGQHCTGGGRGGGLHGEIFSYDSFSYVNSVFVSTLLARIV